MNHRAAAVVACLWTAVQVSAEPTKAWLYIGTYTGKGSKGIYLADLDLKTGKTSNLRMAAETASPSFLAFHPNKRYLYAVGETANVGGKREGSLVAFSIDSTNGGLTLLNRESSKGSGPCHLSVHPTGRFLAAANYGGGSVVGLPIAEDGKLKPATAFVQHTGSSVNPNRQKEPHAHSINFDAAGKFAFAADLGTDKVMVYKIDAAQGAMEPNAPASAPVAAGAGPRHFCFHPSGRYAYAINELANTVTAFSYDATNGGLKEIQSVSSLPESYTGTSYTAEVVAHPNGKFVFGSNRGHNSIATFHVDPETGKLKPIAHQTAGIKTPRNFALDPTGRWCLVGNQDGGSVAIFEVDPESGELHPTENNFQVPAPVCLRMLAVE